LNKFYETFDDVRDQTFDGLIITGAPVELMEYEEVDYWGELEQIFDWSSTHVTSTLFLCWGAQAGLYHFYGIKKHILPAKVFGVFPHRVSHRKIPLVRGFDDIFYAPHSRNTDIDTEALKAKDDIIILAESDEVGVFLAMKEDGSQIFVMGHPEYDRYTLDKEYKRDLGKGIDIALPKNYYPDNDVNKKPLLQWRGHANTLYTNWLDYYVYQNTPYELNQIVRK
jgi:homoserine O-succinyltransferase